MDETGGEVLSHLISLDTRHPASLKQPLSLCHSHGSGERTAQAYTGCTFHTHKYKTKATPRQISQPPGALINGLLQGTGITGMKTREREMREGEQEKG